MKAITYREYGSPDVLQYGDVDKPSPGAGQVLIHVRAASVNPLDWHFMRGTPYFMRLQAGLRRPRETRLGVDVAGQVETVGPGVAQFKVGDAVFGACRGAFAEYVCAPASALVTKPDTVSFEQAATANVAGTTALQGLRDAGHIQAGHTVLINGASGGVGTFAVQIAKSFGADVTGVCSSRNVELVRSLGADRVIDYLEEDFTRGGRRYDLILDCVGNHSLTSVRRVLRPGGAYIVVGAPTGRWAVGFLSRATALFVVSRLSRQTLGLLMVRRRQEDLAFIGDLMAQGKVTPVIDRRYPLSGVPDAIRYLEQGHARGKVIVAFGTEDAAVPE